MGVLQALVLGLVQGLTEFLPVSSSAHLVIVPDLLRWGSPSTSFDVVLHLGTMVAVMSYFWRDVIEILASFFQPSTKRGRRRRRIGVLIAIGTVPAALAGGLLEKQFEEFFNAPSEVAMFMLVTGALLVASESLAPRQRTINELKVLDSILIGIAQAVAILPGISRSGSTISTGLFLGLRRQDAARYSFLLSIPIIAGAAIFKLKHGLGGDSGEGVATLATGFIAASLSGFAAVKFLLGFVQRHSLRVFAYYCWVVGAGVLFYYWLQ